MYYVYDCDVKFTLNLHTFTKILIFLSLFHIFLSSTTNIFTIKILDDMEIENQHFYKIFIQKKKIKIKKEMKSSNKKYHWILLWKCMFFFITYYLLFFLFIRIALFSKTTLKNFLNNICKYTIISGYRRKKDFVYICLCEW